MLLLYRNLKKNSTPEITARKYYIEKCLKIIFYSKTKVILFFFFIFAILFNLLNYLNMKKLIFKLLFAIALTSFICISCEKSSAETGDSDKHKTEEKPAKTETICIVDYNTYNGTGKDGRNFVRTGKVIKSMEPDVAAVQEIDSMTSRNPNDVLKEIAKTAQMNYYYGSTLDSYQGGKYGIGILSKKQMGKLPKQKIKLGTPSEERALILVEFDNYVFCCTHLPEDIYPEEQRNALDKIEKALSAYRFKPVFICGDFNATYQSAIYNKIAESFHVLSNPEINTWPSWDIPQENATQLDRCLDYILQYKNLAKKATVISTGRIESEDAAIASDHNPIYAKIKYEIPGK